MKKSSNGSIWIAAALMGLLCADLYCAEPSEPEISITATAEKPSQGLRSVSPSDVQAALEKIRAAREEPQDNGRATAPSAAMTPLPFAPPAPAKSEIELKAEEIKASLAQLAQKSRTRDPNMPDWTPQWMERQSTPARRGGYCEVAVVCEWKDIFVSIVLAPEDGKSPPVRALASRPSVELIDALPGTLRVEIDGWLPSQQAPVPIYRSQSKRVEKGVRYKLILAADESARIRQFLAETRDRQEEPLTGKKPKEVKFAPSGAAQ